MEIPIAEASGNLEELVRRAEAGDEVVLMCDGRRAVQLVPLEKPGRRPWREMSQDERREILEELRQAGKNALPGPSAARSQDFLYDENGLPA